MYCGSCRHFLFEDTDGYGICNITNSERRCSDTCRKYAESNIITMKLVQKRESTKKYQQQ